MHSHAKNNVYISESEEEMDKTAGSEYTENSNGNTLSFKEVQKLEEI